MSLSSVAAHALDQTESRARTLGNYFFVYKIMKGESEAGPQTRKENYRCVTKPLGEKSFTLNPGHVWYTVASAFRE